MKTYKYKFANGESKIIEIDDEIFKLLRGFENEEARQRMASYRHCVGFELNDEDEEIGICDPYQDLDNEHEKFQEKVSTVLETLTPRQREVAEFIMDGKSFSDIARELKITRQTVNKIKNYIRKAFEDAGLQKDSFCSAMC